MKNSRFCLLLALLPALLSAQPNSPLNGMIKAYPSGQPMSGVNVIAKPGGSDVTQADGSFSFVVSGKVPGDKVFVTPIKGNYRPARADLPITVFVRSNPDDWVIIELCETGKCPEDELYAKFQAEFEKRITSINTEIRQLPANSERVGQLQDSIMALVLQQQEKEALIREMSKQIVRTDFGEASPLTQRALRYLEAGQPDSAIYLFEQAQVRASLQAIMGEEAKAQASLDSLRAQKATFREATLTLARSYALAYQDDSASAAYESAIAADTSDYGTQYDYANYLKDLKQYDQALALYRRLLTKPLDAWQKGNIYGYIGELEAEIGNLPASLEAYGLLRDTYEALLRQDSTNTFYRDNLATSYERLGTTYAALGALDTALRYYEQYNGLMEELHRSNPRSESLKNGLAISYSKLGTTYAALGALDTALRYYQKDLKLSEELYRSNPRSESLKNGLAISYSKLGETYAALGALDTALRYYQDMTVLFEELYRSNPRSESLKNGLAISYEKLGTTYAALGALDTALRYYQDETVLFEELYRSNPRNINLIFGLGVSYYKLATVYEAKKSYDTALDYYRQAADVFRQLYEATGIKSYEGNYLTVARAIEALEEARMSPAEKVTRAQAQIEALTQEDPRSLALAGEYGILSWYLLFDRRYAEAEAAARKGLTLSVSQHTAENQWIYTNLASALLFQGKYAEAKAIYQRFAGQPYPDGKRTWNEVFLTDLDELEAAGITHPDVAKVRELLE